MGASSGASVQMGGGPIPSLAYTPPALEQTRGPTRGSSVFSSLNSPTKEVKSRRGSEAISPSSLRSALFTPGGETGGTAGFREGE